jgi:two-component system, sporulation sensor kinase E
MEDFFDAFESLENLEEESRRMEHRERRIGEANLQRILELTHQINQADEPDHVFARLLSSAIELVDAEFGALVLEDEDGVWTYPQAIDRNGAVCRDPERHISTSIVRQVLQSGVSARNEDIQSDQSLSTRNSVIKLALKSSLCVPLRLQGRIVGVIYVHNQTRVSVFTDTMLVQLEVFCELGSIILTHISLRREERRRYQEVRDLQAYHQSIVDSVPVMLLVVDETGRVHFSNRLTDELLVQNPYLEWTGSAFQVERRVMDRIGFNEETGGGGFDFERQGRTFRLFPFPLPSSERRKGRQGLVISEVTLQKRMEQQLLEKEKSDMLSRMAGSIAHEIKNALTPVKGRLGLLEARIIANAELYHQITPDLRIINEMADRISRIASNLTTLSRPLTMNRQFLDLNQEVEQVLQLLKETGGRIKNFYCGLFDEQGGSLPPGSRFQIDLDLDENLPQQLGDRDYLQQLLMNLLINAAHAVEDKGAGRIRIQTRQVAQSVLLTVSDTGCGIPADQLKRIWDPYFTTKVSGRGSGLGLTLVRMVVEKHEGEMKLESVEGEGTSFTIRFPLGFGREEEPGL